MTSNPVSHTKVPVIGFVAFSGTGKTTLLTRVIPLLRGKNLRIAVIKHTHHDFEIDKPGKDSYELRKAGATQMLLASPRRSALVIEHEPASEVQLQDCLAQLDQSNIDLILVEGFKHEAYPKIEIQRNALNQPALYVNDKHIIAVATDNISPAQCCLPMLDMNNPQQVCDFILQSINHHYREPPKPNE